MNSVSSDYQVNLDTLKTLRVKLNSKVTDHFLEYLAQDTFKLLTEKDFGVACKTFMENWESTPSKSFPLLKDFLAFKGRGFMSEVVSPTEKQRREFCILGRDIKTTRSIPIFRMEAAAKLGIQPEQLPIHGSMLTPEQKRILDIPDQSWLDNFFSKTKLDLDMLLERRKSKVERGAGFVNAFTGEVIT
jgi:hypothetical protein